MTSGADDSDECGQEEHEDDEAVESDAGSAASLFSNLDSIKKSIDSLPDLSMANMFPADVIRSIENIHRINPKVFTALTISQETIEAIQQPTIDPEVLEAVQQASVDPEIIEAIQQPVIDPEFVEQLSAPAIDPALIDALESFDDSTLIETYEAAAALEQIEQKPTSETNEIVIEDDLENPEEGGFLSTFLNMMSVYLLQQNNNLSRGSVETLTRVLQSRSVQQKEDAFREFVDSAKGGTRQMAVIAAVFAFQATFGLFFAGGTGSPDEEESEDTEDSSDKEDDDDSDRGNE